MRELAICDAESMHDLVACPVRVQREHNAARNRSHVRVPTGSSRAVRCVPQQQQAGIRPVSVAVICRAKIMESFESTSVEVDRKNCAKTIRPSVARRAVEGVARLNEPGPHHRTIRRIRETLIGRLRKSSFRPSDS